MTAIETWIETPRGRLFARRSGPPRDSGRTPVVMFHDSLGCVDLWGSFPRSLAEATGRETCVAVVSESAQAVVEARTITRIEDARRALEVPETRARLVAVHGPKTDWIVESWSNAWLGLRKESWTLTETLPRLEVPLLVLHGDQDEFGTLANPTALAEWAGARAKIVFLPDTRHIPHRENRARVLELTKRFLSDED